MQSESLVLPLVLRDSSQASFLQQACSAASPTKLVSWGLDVEHDGAVGNLPTAGAAMGCDDGSIYLFCVDMTTTGLIKIIPPDLSIGNSSTTIINTSLAPHPSQEASTSTPHSTHSPHHSHSRNASTSSHSPFPLSQPTRSRVTSSVSKASVQAPPTHIEHDEGKDRLEGMLRGGPGVREKSIADGLRVSVGVASLGIPGESNGVTTNQHKKIRISHNGATSSAVGTSPESLSSPSSASSFSSFSAPNPSQKPDRSWHVGAAPPLTLKFHLISPRFGTGNCIVSLRYLSSNLLVALQESGLLMVVSTKFGLCLSSIDLQSTPYLHPPPSPSPSAFLATTGDHSVWIWKYLHVIEMAEYTLILAVASDQASAAADDEQSRARVAIVQLEKLNPFLSCLDPSTATRNDMLQKVAEWLYEGPPEAVGLYMEGDASAKLYHVTPAPAPRVVTYNLQLVPLAHIAVSQDSLQPPPEAISSTSVNPVALPTTIPNLLLPIPNPFKLKNSDPPADKNSETVTAVPGRVLLESSLSFSQLPMLPGDRSEGGLQIWTMNGECVRGGLWNRSAFLIFESRVNDAQTRILGQVTHHGLTMVQKMDGDIVILAENQRVNTFRLPYSRESQTASLERLSSTTFGIQCSAVTAISPSLFLIFRTKSNPISLKRQCLTYVPMLPVSLNVRQRSMSRGQRRRSRTAWSQSTKNSDGNGKCQVTALLPLELELIIFGFDDGSLGHSSLTNLLAAGWPAPDQKSKSEFGAITSLHSVSNERTGEQLIVGGVDDGGISVWDLATFEIRAHWTVFTMPLLTVIPLEGEAIGRLGGCIVCVSDDGTLAVISIDGLEFLYLIPGSAARLTRICIGEDNLLLLYADGKARLWDMKTQEFWRSMTNKTADELRRQESWIEAEVGHGEADFRGSLASLGKCFSSYDAASTLLLDIRVLYELVYPFPSSHLFRDPRQPESSNAKSGDIPPLSPPKRVPRRLKIMKSLAGALHSFGIDDGMDEIMKEKLSISQGMASVGLKSAHMATSLLDSSTPQAVWQISPEHTAARLLALVTILRSFLAFDECEPYANQVITFYVTSLQDAIGLAWQAPSLSFLARYWFHTASELRLAARTLFAAAVDRLSNEDTVSLVEHWVHEMPCLQPHTEKQSTYSALALLIAGNIATERYAVLSTSNLTDIAKSITMYLHDDNCPHRVLAIELCSRGFQIWQNYVDAMEILRALFSLSTSAEKERNVGPQARLAVLQIASSNTPLFMTTLSLDILHPKSVQQRKSIMQLVAFLIRKKPLVLYPNLPRLVEAVVKSLDPGSAGDREAVFDAATEILGLVVKTFPSVDFHMSSQKLCVGTSEGAVVMYDLKTATRLYVLEGHKRRLAACSFSPDGRRLVTVSLEEGLVRVWKVGSSLTSLFMPGVPPPQGHPGSEPFKTLNFNVGEDANMTVAATLEWVRFEWPDERTARLKVRDSAFTFNT